MISMVLNYLRLSATETAKKILAENLRQRAHKEAKAIADAKAIAEKLGAVELKMSAKIGQGNKLFGSITNGHVADALAKEGVSMDKKFIQIVGGSVKALGHYTANVRLHREVVVAFEFDVIAIWFYSHKLKKMPITGNLVSAILTVTPFFAIFIYYKNFELAKITASKLSVK